MSFPPFTFIPGQQRNTHNTLYEVGYAGSSSGSDPWDDTEINAAFDKEKMLGNIYVVEESLPPGNWVPVVTSVPPLIHNSHTWVMPTSSISIPTLQSTPVLLSPPPKSEPPRNSRGSGLLYNAVFPPPESERKARPKCSGKLYAAYMEQKQKQEESNESISPDDGDDEDDSIVKAMYAAYRAGYKVGFKAGLEHRDNK